MFFKNDNEIAVWINHTVNNMPWERDEDRKALEIAAVLIASNLIGPDEERIARMLGYRQSLVAAWAANLRRYGVWKKDGTVDDRCWFDPIAGFACLVADVLVAEGIVERKDCPNGTGPIYTVNPDRLDYLSKGTFS